MILMDHSYRFTDLLSMLQLEMTLITFTALITFR